MNMDYKVIPCDIVMPSLGDTLRDLVSNNLIMVIFLLVVLLVVAALAVMIIVSRKKERTDKNSQSNQEGEQNQWEQ